jgi:AcrR family transcriptional regulator
VNQKTRTRAAVLGAAVELLGQGAAPSVPAAAARALVSPATAYRYFPSAEDL